MKKQGKMTKDFSIITESDESFYSDSISSDEPSNPEVLKKYTSHRNENRMGPEVDFPGLVGSSRFKKRNNSIDHSSSSSSYASKQSKQLSSLRTLGFKDANSPDRDRRSSRKGKHHKETNFGFKTMFKSGEKYGNAVKVPRNYRKAHRRESLDFTKALKKNSILINYKLKEYELQMLSSFHTGYFHGYQLDEDQLNSLIGPHKDLSKDRLNHEEIINEIYDSASVKMK